MTFTVSSSILLGHLQLINGAISSSNTLPILEYFLFDLNGTNLIVTATDLETSMSTEVEVVTTDTGKIAVPAKILLDVLKTLPTQPVTVHLNLENNEVKIISGNGKYQMLGESAEDFPFIPEVVEENQISLHDDVLSNAINQALFAVSNDELRPALTGVLLSLDNSGATFVATDTFKLVQYTRTDTNSTESISFILPYKALVLLKNSLTNDKSRIKITYNNTNAFFSFGEVALTCRLIDARFPNYEAVIPTNNTNILQINRSDLSNSLKRMVIYTNQATYRVVFNVGSHNKLSMFAQDIDFSNEANEILQCEYEGDEMEIAFNARFLIDILNVLDSDQVIFKLGDSPNKACLILPDEMPEDTDILMLVIPQTIT